MPIGWHILNVELTHGVPELMAPPDGRGIYVVFWWHAIPIGDRYVPYASLPLPLEELEEFAATLLPEGSGILPFSSPASRDRPARDACEDSAPLPDSARNPERTGADSVSVGSGASHDDTDMGGDSISVVICTRDRPKQLEQCLRSLQTLNPAPHEIVVVDNASETDSTRLVSEAAAGVQYVHEPRPGLDIARNTGARCSTGDIVAYIDDDVQVHEGLLRGIVHGFRAPDVMAVTGLVLPAELETQAQVVFETHWSFNKGFAAKTFGRSFFEQHASRGVPAWEIGAGANMAFRRTVFERVGFFDERLDVGAAGCSGDSEFWFRILAEGFLCRYEPSAVVFHTHRREMEGLKRQLFSYMRGATAAHLIQYQKYRNRGDLRRPLLTLPRWYLQRVAGRLRGQRNLLTPTLSSEVRGVMSGFLFFIRNHRTPIDAIAPEHQVGVNQ